MAAAAGAGRRRLRPAPRLNLCRTNCRRGCRSPCAEPPTAASATRYARGARRRTRLAPAAAAPLRLCCGRNRQSRASKPRQSRIRDAGRRADSSRRRQRRSIVRTAGAAPCSALCCSRRSGSRSPPIKASPTWRAVSRPRCASRTLRPNRVARWRRRSVRRRRPRPLIRPILCRQCRPARLVSRAQT